MNYYIIIIILLSLFLLLRIMKKKHITQVKKLVNRPVVVKKQKVINSKLFKKPLILIPIISIRDNFYERQMGQEILSKTNRYNVFLIPIQILLQFLNLMTLRQHKKLKKIIINENSPYFKSTKNYFLNTHKEYSHKLLMLDVPKPLCANVILSNLKISNCDLRTNSVLNKQKIEIITELNNANNQKIFTHQPLHN